MKNITNLIKKGVLIITTAFLIIGSTTIGTDWYNDINKKYGVDTEKAVEGVNAIRTNGTNQINETAGDTILDTIQNAINRVLGMLSFVALILCLWGGFQMLTAGGDDSKVKSGTKILKNAGLGLAVIGLAWLVVSFVFRIVNKTSGAA